MVIRIKYIIKEAVILLLLFFLISGKVFCQNAQNKVSDSNHFRNSISISFGGVLINSLRFNNYGELLLKSKPPFTSLIEIDYYRNIYKTFGITAGAGLVFFPFNLNYSFNIDKNSGINGNIYGDFVYPTTKNINTFLLLNNFFTINKKINIEVEGGVQLNMVDKYAFPFGIGYIYNDYENDVSLEFLRVDMYDSGPCLSFKSNINLIYKISRRSIIRAGVTLNYSPDHIAEGRYNFSNLPFESYGTIKFGVNYIGLKAGYSFSF